MIDHTPDKLLNFRRQGLARSQALKFLAKTLTLQGFTPIGVRRTPCGVVPRRRRTIADHLARLVPRPQLHQRMHPGVDVERPHVGPDVPQLLLAPTLDLLEIVEVLLDAEAIRRQTQDLRHRHRRLGAEQGQPAMLLAHQHHPDEAANGTPRRQERFDTLDADLPVLSGLHRLPATLVPRPLGQANPPRPIDGRSAPSPPAVRRYRYGTQAGIASQSANDGDARSESRLEERSLGIEAIDHDSYRSSCFTRPMGGSGDQLGRQLQLGTERPAAWRRQAGHVLTADVPPRVQRQAEDAPQGMMHQPGQADPDRAVKELLSARSRRGVVVQAGVLDVAAVTFGRAVVDGEQQWPVGGEPAQGVAEQQAGAKVGLASQNGQEVVVSGEARADVGSVEPTGNGASSLGKEGAQEQHGESSGEALVEEESHAGDQVLPERGEEGKIHSGSPGWGRGRMSTPILARRTCSFQKVINPLLIGDYRVFSESADPLFSRYNSPAPTPYEDNDQCQYNERIQPNKQQAMWVPETRRNRLLRLLV